MILYKNIVYEKSKEPWKFENVYDNGYLYVLEIDDKNIYIGATINLTRRLKQHKDRVGCFTTRKYTELKLIETYILNKITFHELEIYETYLTIKYSKQDTWNSVIGGVFCGVKHRRKKTDISKVESFRLNKKIFMSHDEVFFNHLEKCKFNDDYNFIEKNNSLQLRIDL